MIQLKVYPTVERVKEDSIFLDLYESQPIKLTISIEDITNADATSTFSRTFRVPATRNNDEFFKNAFLVQGVTYDVTTKKPAEILVDGAEFKLGHVRLNKIYVNGDLDKTDYELLFLGETRDFSAAIADSSLCQLVMNDLLPDSGVYTQADIQASWLAFPNTQSVTGGPVTPTLTSGLKDGNILFPLVDHGNNYGEEIHGGTPYIVPLEGVITLDRGTGTFASEFNKAFTEPINDGNPQNGGEWPLQTSRFKPMIRAKRIWDQIFEEAGYSYESDFIDSERFHQMYVSAFGNVEDIGVNIEQSSQTQFSAVEQTPQDFAQGLTNTDYLKVNDNVYNPSGAFIPGASYSRYIAPAGNTPTNYYVMDCQAVAFAFVEDSDGGETGLAWNLDLYNRTQGIILKTSLGQTGNGTANLSYDSRTDSATGDIQQGDVLVMRLDVGGAGADREGCDSASWICTSAPGSYYAPGDLDCEYKQIDFIKDILTAFRLVMQPDASKPNHFKVEPWQDFIGSGTTYDWTSKLVKDKDFLIEPLFNNQSQTIDFTMQEDEDFINKFHQDNYKHPYGWLQFNSANELLKGKRDITLSGISPTPLDQIEQRVSGGHLEPDFVVTQIHKHESVDARVEHLPIKPNTRLLFYNGLQTITQPDNYWYLEGINNPFPTYPLVSPNEDWPPQSTSLNLNFYNDIRYYGNIGTTGTTLFSEYWSRYIGSIYNKFSRKVTAYFTLDNTDLQDLTFDDLIFVKGVYYRPQLISNAEVGNKTQVKVELITVLDAKPSFRNELLTNVAITTAAGGCAGAGGSIAITTNGTPNFNVVLSNGFTSSYSDTPGNAPYNFTLNNIPGGTYDLEMTDALQRTWNQQVIVPSGSGTNNPTASYLITNATVCFEPNCDGQVVITPAGGSGSYTVVWSDIGGTQLTTRTAMCSGNYSFYIVDSNGCESGNYPVEIQCDATPISWEIENVTGGFTQYISYPNNLTINIGDSVGLSGQPNSCWEVIDTSYNAVTLLDNVTNFACGAQAEIARISPCDGGPDVFALNDFSNVAGDIVQYQIGGQGATYCGEIINLNAVTQPNVVLTNGVNYADCNVFQCNQ